MIRLRVPRGDDHVACVSFAATPVSPNGWRAILRIGQSKRLAAMMMDDRNAENEREDVLVTSPKPPPNTRDRIVDEAPQSKPRHNFVYLSADVSRPYRVIVNPRIYIRGPFVDGSLILPLWGIVAGETDF